jgi:hypothetical protein
MWRSRLTEQSTVLAYRSIAVDAFEHPSRSPN